MSTITKKRAQEIFLGNGPEPTASEERELARIALASLEAEAVAYIIQDAQARGLGRPGFLSFDASISDEDINEYEISVTPLYTAPQLPQPAVAVQLAIHDEDFEKALSVLNDTLDDCGDSERGLLLALDKAGIEVHSDACRAAILQGDERLTSLQMILFACLPAGLNIFEKKERSNHLSFWNELLPRFRRKALIPNQFLMDGNLFRLTQQKICCVLDNRWLGSG